MCSGVGNGKMDYPTQQAIYHCQRGRERKSGERGKGREKRGSLRVREGEGYGLGER